MGRSTRSSAVGLSRDRVMQSHWRLMPRKDLEVKRFTAMDDKACCYCQHQFLRSQGLKELVHKVSFELWS